MAGDIGFESISVIIPNLRALPANNTKRGFVIKPKDPAKKSRVVVVDKVKGRAKYLDLLRFHASMAAAREDWNPNHDAVHVEYRFVFARPAEHYGTGRNAGKVKPSAPLDHLTKPDVVNLVKPIEDAMTGILWDDDRQVVSFTASKHWSANGRDAIAIVARRAVTQDQNERKSDDTETT